MVLTSCELSFGGWGDIVTNMSEDQQLILMVRNGVGGDYKHIYIYIYIYIFSFRFCRSLGVQSIFFG